MSFLSPPPLPVFLAPWIKGLIAVVVIGVVIVALIVAAKCYFLRKARGEHISKNGRCHSCQETGHGYEASRRRLRRHPWILLLGMSL